MNIPRRTIQRLFKALAKISYELWTKFRTLKLMRKEVLIFTMRIAISKLRDIFINATGFEMDLMEVSKQSHLIHNLINRQLILPHESGQGPFVSWPDTRLMTRRTKIPHFSIRSCYPRYSVRNNNARLIAQQGKISALSFIDQYCDGDTR